MSIMNLIYPIGEIVLGPGGAVGNSKGSVEGGAVSPMSPFLPGGPGGPRVPGDPLAPVEVIIVINMSIIMHATTSCT